MILLIVIYYVLWCLIIIIIMFFRTYVLFPTWFIYLLIHLICFWSKKYDDQIGVLYFYSRFKLSVPRIQPVPNKIPLGLQTAST